VQIRPDHFMNPVAMWEAAEQCPQPEWGDLVADEEYRQR
jgi:hypothetical protein